MSLSKNIYPSLELVHPRKARAFITERLLMGRKESNQTNKPFKINDSSLQAVKIKDIPFLHNQVKRYLFLLLQYQEVITISDEQVAGKTMIFQPRHVISNNVALRKV